MSHAGEPSSWVEQLEMDEPVFNPCVCQASLPASEWPMGSSVWRSIMRRPGQKSLLKPQETPFLVSFSKDQPQVQPGSQTRSLLALIWVLPPKGLNLPLTLVKKQKINKTKVSNRRITLMTLLKTSSGRVELCAKQDVTGPLSYLSTHTFVHTCAYTDHILASRV